ncbi:hypothetical protein BZA77DRAFT_361248 [Pyronema omphalodes]|nr:hypothetical protein BZA77DRAFT_361248 [Pyronema omphalodes]
MKREHACSDAKKDASIKKLEQELDTKIQALEKACSSVKKEKEFRKKLEDALDVLRQMETEHKQELEEVKAELQRNLQRRHARSTTPDESDTTDCNNVTEGGESPMNLDECDSSTTADISGTNE